MRLKIGVEPDGPGARLTGDRRWLSLGPAGDRWLAEQSAAAYEERMDGLRDALRAFVASST